MVFELELFILEGKNNISLNFQYSKRDQSQSFDIAVGLVGSVNSVDAPGTSVPGHCVRSAASVLIPAVSLKNHTRQFWLPRLPVELFSAR